MLISCPSCPKTYEIPDHAISATGRTVKCGACDHSWRVMPHQEVPSDPTTKALAKTLLDRLTADLQDEPPRFDAMDFDDIEPSASMPDARSVTDGAPQDEGADDVADEAETASPIAQSKAIVVASSADVSVHRARRTARARSARRVFGERFIPSHRALVDRVRLHWTSWRAEKERAAQVPPGNAAAREFRARARYQIRNKLTPLRLMGWMIWAGAAVAVGWSTLMHPTWVQTVYPPSANLYERFAEAPAPPLDVKDLTTRFVTSTEGPVLEIRGSIHNVSTGPVDPEFYLTAIGAERTEEQLIRVGHVQLPAGGEQPFVVRASVPHDTRRASISVVSSRDNEIMMTQKDRSSQVADRREWSTNARATVNAN